MKKIFNLIIIFLTVTMLCNIMIPIISYATGLETGFNTFEQADKTPSNVKKLIDNSAGTSVSVLRVVGIAIAVIMLLVIAMRYMIAAPTDRADIKKHAINYVIGAFILFGVTGILGILIDLSSVFNEG